MNLVSLTNWTTVVLWSAALFLWGLELIQKKMAAAAFFLSRDAIHSLLWFLIVLGLLGSVIQTYQSGHSKRPSLTPVASASALTIERHER